MKRSIVLFPYFSNMDLIQAKRGLYDPLVNSIRPHLTLVFPFSSEIPSEILNKHLINQLQKVNPFEIILNGVTGDCNSGYVFLNIKKGNDSIIELHDLLYSNLLKEFFCREVIYTPHITIGKLNNYNDFKYALDDLSDFDYKFKTIIDSVFVEIIADDESSTIEFEYKF